jgi:hypothetical protein
MNTKQTQTKLILRYLKSGRHITPLDALVQFGCQRLAARIADLRKAGLDVHSKMIRTLTGKRVASYSLR